MINIKRTRRIYSDLGLQLRAKSPKRRVKAKLREDRCPASQPNETWAMDFVHDQLALGNKLRVLTVVDIFSKFSPVIDPRFSYRAEDVVMTLERVCGEVGYPKTIRVDQGSEFVSRDLDLWAYANNVTLDFSRPGKPTDNAFIEAFNSKFRSECLNAHWFMSLDDAPKVGGLAQILQRGKTAQRDWPIDAGSAAQTQWRIQPATGQRGRKLWPQVIQRLGAEQRAADSTQIWRSLRGSGHLPQLYL